MLFFSIKLKNAINHSMTKFLYVSLVEELDDHMDTVYEYTVPKQIEKLSLFDRRAESGLYALKYLAHKCKRPPQIEVEIGYGCPKLKMFSEMNKQYKLHRMCLNNNEIITSRGAFTHKNLNKVFGCNYCTSNK